MMSKKDKQELRSCQIFLSKCKESHITAFGKKATQHCIDCFTIWVMCVFDVITYYGDILPEPSLDLFLNHLSVDHIELDDIISTLKKADNTIIQYWVRPRCACERPSYEELFKDQFLYDILYPIKGSIEACIDARSDVDIQAIRTIFLFMSRLTYVTPAQKDDVVEGWLGIQHNMLDAYPPLHPRIPTLFGLDQIPIELAIPGNGTGSVSWDLTNLTSKQTTTENKYLFSTWSPRLEYLTKRYPNLRHPFGLSAKGQPCSRVELVPKSFGKYRMITKAPPANMYVQKGLFDALDAHFQDHAYLKRRINLHNSSQNERLAQLGSVDGNLCTIDLTSASDYVSTRLFLEWFGHTSLRMPILASRTSTTILPSGNKCVMKTLATQGEAICFPVMCLIFAAACEQVIMNAGRRSSTSQYSVYGDDIVIEREYAPALVDFLESCGFIVNKEKSFIGSDFFHHFRESCGGHYLDGNDVTPCYIPRSFQGFSNLKKSTLLQQPEKLANLIDLSNRLFCACFFTARRFVVFNLLSCAEHIPFQEYGREIDSMALISTYSTNYNLLDTRKSRRLTLSYQRKCKAAWCLSTDYGPKDKDIQNNEVALFEWLRLSEKRSMSQYETYTIRENGKVRVSPKGRVVSALKIV